MPPDSAAADSASTTTEPRQHGVKGVYYAGDWVDIEDLDGTFYPSATAPCSGCDSAAACPAVRSRSRNFDPDRTEYDVVIVGAGCVGASVARELSKYDAAGGVLWVEAADDVSQGATKGNSGIVHAGYDDEPGSVRARYCWRGNQMFAALDGELRFGYQRNGSLVLAFTERERAVLHELYDRGRQNGVERLQIIEREEVLKKEPHVNPNVVAALYSPDAGNVIPYEFAIALAENAVDNGVQLMVRTTVKGIKQVESGEGFEVHLETWEPAEYLEAVHHSPFTFVHCALGAAGLATVAHWLVVKLTGFDLGTTDDLNTHLAGLVVIMILFLFQKPFSHSPTSHHAPLKKLVEQAGRAVGAVGGPAASTRDRVTVDDMLVGGSGSERVTRGVPTGRRTVKCRYVVNAAGGAADRIASMIGDGSFTIKPRLGDYLLLNRNQVRIFSEQQKRFCCLVPSFF
jgi:glycine/D-amino acid oxidase-like deaminating enzyme